MEVGVRVGAKCITRCTNHLPMDNVYGLSELGSRYLTRALLFRILCGTGVLGSPPMLHWDLWAPSNAALVFPPMLLWGPWAPSHWALRSLGPPKLDWSP